MSKINLTLLPTLKISYKPSINPLDCPKVKSSKEAEEIFRQYWDEDSIMYIEEVKVLLLNRANRCIGIVDLSKGGVCGTVIDVKVILQHCLLANAISLILAHNHPSCNLQPSAQDITITNKLKEAAKIMDINLLDHLVLTQFGYRSMADEGDI